MFIIRYERGRRGLEYLGSHAERNLQTRNSGARTAEPARVRITSWMRDMLRENCPEPASTCSGSILGRRKLMWYVRSDIGPFMKLPMTTHSSMRHDRYDYLAGAEPEKRTPMESAVATFDNEEMSSGHL